MTLEGTNEATRVATKKLMDQAEHLARLDHHTLQAAVAIISSTGLRHFQLSKDTRLTTEARKAHKFVAMNCETISRNVMAMSGLPDETVEALLRDIFKQTQDFFRGQKKDAARHAAQQPGPAGTGSA